MSDKILYCPRCQKDENFCMAGSDKRGICLECGFHWEGVAHHMIEEIAKRPAPEPCDEFNNGYDRHKEIEAERYEKEIKDKRYVDALLYVSDMEGGKS